MTDRPVDVEETRDLWDRKAAFWDERFGDGNVFHKQLVEPAVLRLLDVPPGWRVLDVATGNGAFARALATRGVRVTAIDFSEVFLARARARGGEGIDYRLVDATDEDALLALGEGQFDAAVANMALMDMPAIDPLARALARLVRAGGRFVFSVQHPCFNSNATDMVAETTQRDGGIEVVNAMKVRGYLHVAPGKGAGMPGEPNPHYYFHRPITELLGAFFRVGMVLDGMEEPTFARTEDPLTWRGVGGQIPPVLVARMRVA